ncbi:MAG: flagellar hook-length control protein FliK [Pseudomonadales bacterium]|jgi:flagellar hook-length control protein FliK|nr:flagellar hook-length control protein FliK [Pseudomonadales bacterium]
MEFLGQLSLDVGRLRGGVAPGTTEQTRAGAFAATLDEVAGGAESGDTAPETALAPPAIAAPAPDEATPLLPEAGGKGLPAGPVDGGSTLPLLYAEQIDAEALDDEAPVRVLTPAILAAEATVESPTPATRGLAELGRAGSGAPRATDARRVGGELGPGGAPAPAGPALDASDAESQPALVTERDRAGRLDDAGAAADLQASAVGAGQPGVDSAGVAASVASGLTSTSKVRPTADSGALEAGRAQASAVETGSSLRRSQPAELRAPTRMSPDEAMEMPATVETFRPLEAPAQRAADAQPAAVSAATGGASGSLFAAPGAAVAATAASGAPATGSATLATLPPMDGAGFERSLGARVDALLEADGGRVSLRLTPAHLGTVELSVVMSEEGAQISLVASQAAARELLESALPKLRDQFAAAGHMLDSVQLEAGDPGAREDGRESGRGLADRGDHGAGADAAVADAAGVAQAAAARASLRAASLLDTYA